MIRWSAKEVGRHLHDLPMLRVVLPVVGGILAESLLELPGLYLWGGVVVAGGCALRFRSSLYITVALLLLGMGCASLHRHEAAPPMGEGLYVVRVESQPVLRERYSTASAHLVAWCDKQGVWRGSEKRLSLYADSTLTIRIHEELTLRGRLRPYREADSFYARLQAARGYVGMLWASESALLQRDSSRGPGWIEGLHLKGSDGIARMGLSPEIRAVVEAMTIGERSHLTPALRESYARSGASHLLAVSGLHVGILFLFVNALMWGLPLLNGGHRLKALIATAAIWLYALVAGASPGVLRAAWMFTALQLAHAFSLRYRGLNILFGVAVVMLLLEPRQLFDISFQLSFLAVVAILSWGAPLLRGLHNRFFKGLAALFLIGGVATLATAPLSVYRFGIFAPIGVVINPVVIFTAELLLGLTLLALFIPAGPALLGWAVEWTASLQNEVVRRAAEWEWGSFDLQSDGTTTLLIYLFLILMTLAAWGLKRIKPLKLEDDDLG